MKLDFWVLNDDDDSSISISGEPTGRARWLPWKESSIDYSIEIKIRHVLPPRPQV